MTDELITDAIYAFLAADTNVSARLGDRIYPLTIPQTAALPAAAYQVITSVSDLTHDGPSGLVEINLQITITAETYRAAKLTAKTIRQALDGYNKQIGVFDIFAIAWQNEYDGYAQQQGRATVRQDYSVKYEEL